MAVRRKRQCSFRHTHLMDLVCRIVAKFLTGTFVTNELFRVKAARDYDPILVKNAGDPVWRQMLRDEYLLEYIIRHPDYHRVEPLPALVLNGHIDQCEPVIFNATQVSALGAARPQTSRNRDTAYGTRWFACVD